jgi:hypothetical protein
MVVWQHLQGNLAVLLVRPTQAIPGWWQVCVCVCVCVHAHASETTQTMTQILQPMSQ